MRISDWSSDVCSSDLIIHTFINRIDFEPLRLRVIIAGQCTYRIETTIEYTDNIRRLVINNTSQLFVPQQWYSYPTTIFGVGSGIDLVEISSPMDCIGDHAGAVLKCQTFVEHKPMDHRQGQELLRTEERRGGQACERKCKKRRDP